MPCMQRASKEACQSLLMLQPVPQWVRGRKGKCCLRLVLPGGRDLPCGLRTGAHTCQTKSERRLKWGLFQLRFSHAGSLLTSLRASAFTLSVRCSRVIRAAAELPVCSELTCKVASNARLSSSPSEDSHDPTMLGLRCNLVSSSSASSSSSESRNACDALMLISLPPAASFGASSTTHTQPSGSSRLTVAERPLYCTAETRPRMRTRAPVNR